MSFHSQEHSEMQNFNMDNIKRGMIHIYCGDGKGKTTAALGLALRAAGAGMKVYILQFLKSSGSSEYNSISKIDNIKITSAQNKVKFVFNMSESEKKELTEDNNRIFCDIVKKSKSNEFDVLVLDEIIGCVECGVIDEDLILNFLENKPDGLEIIMTGRNPSERLIQCADYVSCITKVKHPFDNGENARKGIEF